jgi:hypothetical protein
MKIKALIATAAVALAVLIPVTSANAQSTGQWYWSAKTTANAIYQDNLHWNNGQVDTVTYVRCRGQGERYQGLFKRFRCYVESVEDHPYFIRVNITGENSYRFGFLRYA